MLRNNKGIALLITLTVVTVMIAVTFELNRQLRSSVTTAAVTRDYLTLSHTLASGVNIAKTILVRDKQDTEVDSIQEDWANPEVIDAYIRQAGFENSEVNLYISDERSRIQINALVQYPDGREFNTLQRELWMRFFELLISQQEQGGDVFLSEPLEPSMIINPVKDWLDFGDNDAITGLTGAENDYYRDMDPPYGCRNGPFKHVSELLRVRNVTPELFYSVEESIGVQNYITVFGMSAAEESRHKFSYDGKININTAEMPVIAALLPLGHEFLATEIVAYREEKANDEFIHDLSSQTWYKEVPGMGDVDIDPALITTSSDLFRIECGATLNEASLGATVIVLREKNAETGKWQCKVLNWRYE